MKTSIRTERRKPFAVISDTEGRFRFWVARRSRDGEVMCVASFSMERRMPLVDAIDTLGYAKVERVTNVDKDLSYLSVRLKSSDLLERFIEDIPELMSQWVTTGDGIEEEKKSCQD